MTENNEEPENDSVEYFSLMDLFRDSGHEPTTGLLVLHSLMASGEEIPKEMRDWFTRCLALTLDSNGEVSLDKAFGLSGDGGEHSAFTISNRRYKNISLMHEMHTLVCVYGFKETVASRLIYERMKYNEETSPSSESQPVKAAETIRSQYNKQKYSWTYESKDFTSFDLSYLEDYDVPQLSPFDRNKLHSVLDSVREDIQSV